MGASIVARIDQSLASFWRQMFMPKICSCSYITSREKMSMITMDMQDEVTLHPVSPRPRRGNEMLMILKCRIMAELQGLVERLVGHLVEVMKTIPLEMSTISGIPDSNKTRSKKRKLERIWSHSSHVPLDLDISHTMESPCWCLQDD